MADSKSPRRKRQGKGQALARLIGPTTTRSRRKGSLTGRLLDVSRFRGRASTGRNSGTPQPTRVHQSPSPRPSTLALRRRHTPVHSGTPDHNPTRVHRGTPTLPAQQPTAVHLSTPLSNDVAVRLLSLLPDLELIVARERDRQRLLSTPIGTPRHTAKKTYVVDTLYVDLIERYAQAEGVELKDVVNLAFHEFFERRQYLPVEE